MVLFSIKAAIVVLSILIVLYYQLPLPHKIPTLIAATFIVMGLTNLPEFVNIVIFILLVSVILVGALSSLIDKQYER